jgi:hypothetical protein
MRIRRAAREVLIEIAFAVRHDGNAARSRQHLAGARRGVEPAPRFLICGDARTPWRNRTFISIPYLSIDKSE